MATFAQRAQAIINKYDIRPGDSASQNAKNAELQALKEQQEQVREQMALDEMGSIQNSWDKISSLGIDPTQMMSQAQPMDLYPDIEQRAEENSQVSQAKYGGIHIKDKNKGKFTNWVANNKAKLGGKTTVPGAADHIMKDENKSKFSPEVVKMANFAKNARGWAGYGGNRNPYARPKAQFGNPPPIDQSTLDYIAGLNPQPLHTRDENQAYFESLLGTPDWGDSKNLAADLDLQKKYPKLGPTPYEQENQPYKFVTPDPTRIKKTEDDDDDDDDDKNNKVSGDGINPWIAAAQGAGDLYGIIQNLRKKEARSPGLMGDAQKYDTTLQKNIIKRGRADSLGALRSIARNNPNLPYPSMVGDIAIDSAIAEAGIDTAADTNRIQRQDVIDASNIAAKNKAAELDIAADDARKMALSTHLTNIGGDVAGLYKDKKAMDYQRDIIPLLQTGNYKLEKTKDGWTVVPIT